MSEAIAIAHLTLAGVIFTALVSAWCSVMQLKNNRDTTQINDAVNHSHHRGGKRLHQRGGKRLLDVVREIEAEVKKTGAWRDSYAGGPLDDGAKVVQFVGETRDHFVSIDNKLTDIILKMEHEG